MKTSVNYIIVGQGLAGTILAQTLIKSGKSIIIINDCKSSSASMVAAGLYNPVVFKRLVKSWKADELISFMDKFYVDSETLLGEHFYFKKQIVKLFSEEQEKVLWLKKSKEDVGRYLSKTIQNNFLKDLIHYNSAGESSEVIDAGNLNTSLFLNSFENYFKINKQHIDEIFEYDKLTFTDHSVNYKNINADKLIFCEGYKTIHNPYFNWLPFKLTKGELLTIKIPMPLEDELSFADKVINKGVFVLPLGNNFFKVGATYEWTDLSENTTAAGKNFLIEKLDKIFKVPYEIVIQQAGIRPTVIDRRPLIGMHKHFPSLGIFNGMGTKGVMLAPFFANQFADFLENKTVLDKEVDIARFSNN